MYYPYLILCYITWPIRKAMFWWRYSDFEFAVYILFRSSVKVALVNSVSRSETRDFKSESCVKDNNYFGIGVSKEKKYQSGVASVQSQSALEPTFAKYSSIYQSIYDYYDLVYYRFKTIGVAMDKVPEVSTPSETEMVNYFSQYAIAAKISGYFRASIATYINNLKSNLAISRYVGLYSIVSIIGSVFAIYYLNPVKIIKRYIRV